MLAQQAQLQLGEFIWMGGDVHLYNNHVPQAREQLTRSVMPLPTMRLAVKRDCIDDYTVDVFVIDGYEPHPAIKADVAV
jgi:thymidylate synthase